MYHIVWTIFCGFMMMRAADDRPFYIVSKPEPMSTHHSHNCSHHIRASSYPVGPELSERTATILTVHALMCEMGDSSRSDVHDIEQHLAWAAINSQDSAAALRDFSELAWLYYALCDGRENRWNIPAVCKQLGSISNPNQSHCIVQDNLGDTKIVQLPRWKSPHKKQKLRR